MLQVKTEKHFRLCNREDRNNANEIPDRLQICSLFQVYVLEEIQLTYFTKTINKREESKNINWN